MRLGLIAGFLIFIFAFSALVLMDGIPAGRSSAGPAVPPQEALTVATKQSQPADYPAKHLGPAERPDAAALVPVSTVGQSAARGLPDSVTLTFTYMERLRIPKGSSLDVRLQDARGVSVYDKHLEIRQDAPPYGVDVPLAKALIYPITINASLTSPIGHKLSTQAELTSAETRSNKPIDLILSLQ